MKIGKLLDRALGGGLVPNHFQQDMMSHLLTDIHLMLKRLSSMD